MSEVISTTFQADSDDFNAEVKKAQAVIDGLTGKSLPLMEKNMNDAFFAAQKTAKGMSAMAAASKQTGGGLLQLAYVADDLQYGMKGIANNIPGLVQGLGMSAGIAGAASIAALALWKIGPPLLQALDLTDKMGTALNKTNRQINDLIYNFQLEEQAIITREKAQQAHLASLAQYETALDALNKIDPVEKAEKEIQATRRQIEAQRQLMLARAANAEARSSGSDLAQTSIRQQKEVFEEKMATDALAKEIERRKRLMNEIATQVSKVYAVQGNQLPELESRKTNTDQEIKEAELRIRQQKRNAAAAQAAIDNMKGKGSGFKKDDVVKGAESSLKSANAIIAEQTAKITALKQQQAETLAILEKTKTVTQQAAETYQKQITANREALTQLENELTLRQQIQTIAADTRKRELEKVQAQKEGGDSASADLKAAMKDASQRQALTQMQAEIVAMRAQAAGQKKLADEIRNRIALAQEARQIAAATGMSEKQALEIAKEKASLQSQIDSQKTKAGDDARDGRIRLFKAGESPSTLQRGAAGTMLRSEAFTRRTQAWMDTPMRTKSATDQVAADQLKTQQRLLQIWEKNLGLI